MSQLPEGWKEVQLDTVLEKFQNGYAFSSEGYVETGTPIISMANISLKGAFQFNYRKAKYWDTEELNNLEQYQLNKGDLLIAMTDVTPDKKLIGRMAIVDIDDKFLLNQRVGLLKLKECINSKFLCEYGNFTIWRKYSKNVAALGAQANISTKDIKNGKIPLPPLEEQKKIADILSTVDQKIAFIEENISQTQELKKGLMQKLLTEGIGHREFKDSEIGRIPKNWEVKNIEEVASVKGGKRMPKGTSLTEEKNQFPYIRVTNMFMGGIDLREIQYVPEETQFQIKNYIISKNDLFISVAGTLGVVGEIPEELDNANLTENANKLTDIKIHKKYLLYLLMSSLIQNEITKQTTSNAQPKLALTRIKTFKIPIPSVEEQEQISEILSTVDQKLEVLKDKIGFFQELKKGLMQKLLTGEVRV